MDPFSPWLVSLLLFVDDQDNFTVWIHFTILNSNRGIQLQIIARPQC